jgi:single-strand DNA-binding protein
MNDIASEQRGAPTNVVLLKGYVRGDSTSRALPSGSTVVQFDVATSIVDGARTSTVSVPVAWTDPSVSALAAVTDGSEVVVIGTGRRRFFRVGGATQSRTEVVVDSVIPARRRRTVATALEAVAARLAS